MEIKPFLEDFVSSFYKVPIKVVWLNTSSIGVPVIRVDLFVRMLPGQWVMVWRTLIHLLYVVLACSHVVCLQIFATFDLFPHWSVLVMNTMSHTHRTHMPCLKPDWSHCWSQTMSVLTCQSSSMPEALDLHEKQEELYSYIRCLYSKDEWWILKESSNYNQNKRNLCTLRFC